MKKNYEKIYKRLIKEIKRMEKDEHNPNNYAHEDTAIMREVEKRASQFGITILNCILEMNEEINGTKCNRIIMGEEEFRKWSGNNILFSIKN